MAIRLVGTNVAAKVDPISFPTEIETGGLSGHRLFADLRDLGINVGHNARWALTSESAKFTTSPKRRKVKVTRCKLRDLFEKKPTFEQIQKHIEEIGGTSHPENALHLRKQFLEQPKGDHFWFIIKPIPVSLGGLPGIFYLCSNGSGLWIEILAVSEDVCWNLDTEIAYIPK